MQDLYIENAGLVLVAPLLSQLLSTSNLVVDEAIIDESAVEQAVYLLQHVASSISDVHAHQLAFNKALCGIAVDAPLRHDSELSYKHRDEADSMLGAVIDQWKALVNTSIEGLRQ